MSIEQLTTIADISQFLEGTQDVAFRMATRTQERYYCIQKTLVSTAICCQINETEQPSPAPDDDNGRFLGLLQATDKAIAQNRHSRSEASSRQWFHAQL